MPPTPRFSPRRIRHALVHLQKAKPSGPNPLLVRPKHRLSRPDWCPRGLHVSAGSTRGLCATTGRDVIPGLVPTFAIFSLPPSAFWCPGAPWPCSTSQPQAHTPPVLPSAFWCTEAQLACHTFHPQAHIPPALFSALSCTDASPPIGLALDLCSVMFHSISLLARTPHAQPACAHPASAPSHSPSAAEPAGSDATSRTQRVTRDNQRAAAAAYGPCAVTGPAA